MDSPARSILSHLGLTGRLILALTLVGALVFGIVFSINYSFTSHMVEQQVVAHAQDVVKAAVQSIDALLQGAVRDQQVLVSRLETVQRLTPRQVTELLRNHLEVNDEIFGSTASFEPSRAPGGRRRFAPYFFRRIDNRIGYADLAVPRYDYLHQVWYTSPKQQLGPVWTEPYFDEGGGNVVMTTYAVPFYRQFRDGRQLAGVVTADISVDWLGRQVSGLHLYRNGYASLFSRKGVYLTHPNRALVLKESIFDIANTTKNPALKELGQAIARQETGVMRGQNIFGQDSWIYYAPVPSTGWSLAVVFPTRALLADVRTASRTIALACAGGFVLLVLAIVLVARSITRPVVEITAAAQRIAAGDLDGHLPQVTVGGEVGELANAFGRMQHDLKQYIAQLTETTAAKERMAGELAAAHDLQMAMLPRQLPAIGGLELAGTCCPAREVGGDLYDARLLDDGRLFFMIGDVSGKGVPAALYMAITVSLARAIVQEGEIGPAELLARINRELARDNDTSMFVTLFCGILDLASGELRYANAGHNPPVLINRDGGASLPQIVPGLVAGCLDDYCYEEGRLDLAAGMTLLLYTDGVTEALNPAQELFGEERLLATLNGTHSAARSISALQQAVKSFVTEADQADDITMLAIRISNTPGSVRVDNAS